MSDILIDKRVMVVVAIKTLQALSDLYNKNKFYGSKKESGKESCKEGCEEGSSKEEGRKEDSKACLIANLQLFFQKRSITPMMLLFYLTTGVGAIYFVNPSQDFSLKTATDD